MNKKRKKECSKPKSATSTSISSQHSKNSSTIAGQKTHFNIEESGTHNTVSYSWQRAVKSCCLKMASTWTHSHILPLTNGPLEMPSQSELIAKVDSWKQPERNLKSWPGRNFSPIWFFSLVILDFFTIFPSGVQYDFKNSLHVFGVSIMYI